MNRVDYLRNLTSPLPNAVLKKHPHGNIMQFWGENPELYSAGMDAFHMAFGGHMGIDIKTFHRDPVRAAHDGLVVIVNNNRADARNHQGGIEVWITSPELDGEFPGNSRIQTVYCHLDETIVSIGMHVEQGQIIGYEGNTGMVVSGGNQYWGNAPAGVGTHLHFGLYEDIKVAGLWFRRYKNVLRDSIDPLPWISETPENPGGDITAELSMLKRMAVYLSNNRSL
jgi:murein DD-endopeptidase MepM/ murein hydrolase activator NlpD